MSRDTCTERVRVWDVPVRVLHASLIAGFFAAWFTRHVRGPWHEWFGYSILAIIGARLLWGFLGTRYARFSQFVCGAGTTLRYAGTTLRGCQPRYLGHNPLGGLMIVLLLCTVLATCLSGWLYITDRFWGIEWIENLHETLSNLSLALIALHVTGVLLGSRHDRENLVASMVHGRKRPPGVGDIV